jgi:hypothetical protein
MEKIEIIPKHDLNKHPEQYLEPWKYFPDDGTQYINY